MLYNDLTLQKGLRVGLNDQEIIRQIKIDRVLDLFYPVKGCGFINQPQNKVGYSKVRPFYFDERQVN